MEWASAEPDTGRNPTPEVGWVVSSRQDRQWALPTERWDRRREENGVMGVP